MQHKDFELNAEIRSDLGKGASRRLRHLNRVPAIIYGGGKDPQNLTIAHNELVQQLDQEAFYSHILKININGKAQKAVLRDVQRHPSKPVILHIDLLRVSEKESIRMSVPLHFQNADTCKGVKLGGGIVTHLITQVEVQCLAKDLPEFIEIDLVELDIGDSVHLSDIKLPKGIEVVELSHGHDLAVVNILKPRAVTEDEEIPAAGEVPPAAEPEADK